MTKHQSKTNHLKHYLLFVDQVYFKMTYEDAEIGIITVFMKVSKVTLHRFYKSEYVQGLENVNIISFFNIKC